MSETTSILDLPTDPLGGGSNMNNISLNAIENVAPNMQQTNQPPNSVSLDQTTISQIVSGLQQASFNGATKLPSRDIPMTTTGLNTDPYVQPNYVPSPPQPVDYIKNHENPEDMIHEYNKSTNRQNTLDDMYNEVQLPLLLAVLYFFFQLPFFRKFLFGYFPILFSNDGNLNINGLLFMSILFAILFYLINKVTSHFSAF
jgi:hypothetical protein